MSCSILKHSWNLIQCRAWWGHKLPSCCVKRSITHHLKPALHLSIGFLIKKKQKWEWERKRERGRALGEQCGMHSFVLIDTLWATACLCWQPKSTICNLSISLHHLLLLIRSIAFSISALHNNPSDKVGPSLINRPILPWPRHLTMQLHY